MRNVAQLAAAVLLVAGCSTLQVHASAAPNANLEQLHTFAFMQPVDPNSQAAQLDRTPAGQQVRAQITRDLEEKGYAPAPAGVEPDFLVAYRADLRERTQVQSWGGAGPWGYGYGWGWGGWAWDGPQVTVSQYTEGTLVVDFVHPRTQQVLWRGTVSGVVNHPQNPDLNKLAKAVDKLMNKYPTSAMASVPRTHM